jgi:hypothetical protein
MGKGISMPWEPHQEIETFSNRVEAIIISDFGLTRKVINPNKNVITIYRGGREI